MKTRGLWLFVFTVALIFSASVQAQNFNNPVRISTLQDPYSVFAVDLNGDGFPDLLDGISGINSTPGSVQTWMAQPSGGYAQGPTLTLPSLTGNCYPADVDGDGKQDLVCLEVLTQGAQIAVFLGNGDGSFQAAFVAGSVHSNYASFRPFLYVPAPLRSGSYPDLVIADLVDPQTFILINDGTGHFTEASTITTSGPTNVYVSDVNGDGKPDLLFPYGPTVYLGKGDGTFNAAQSYGNFDSCNFHDMDGDGHADAICVTEMLTGSTYAGTNELAILHGNADGSFNTTPIASQTYGNPQGGNAAIQSVAAIVDVNGDGIPDILGSSDDGLAVLLGKPNQQFAAPVHYAISNFGGTRNSTSQVADLNWDGRPDIVTTGASGLYISYGRRDGTFQAPPADSVATILGGMTVADFNGDGIPDIAATGDASVELSLGNGDGTFQPPVALPSGGIGFSTVSTALNITHGDFRGTGYQDILAIGSPSIYQYNSYIFLNNGDGTFSAPQLVPNSSTNWPNLENYAIADLNGDHRDDFLFNVIGASSPAVEAGISNGDGTFATVTTTLPYSGSGYVPFPAVADFDKDGKADLVFVAGSNANVLKGNGDGSFNTSALVLAVPAYPGQTSASQLLATARGDFDGDGNQDFAVLALVGPWMPPPSPYTNIASAVYVFYGNGDGTFAAPVVAGGSTAVYDTIYTADVNKDGRTDLILAKTGTEATSWAVPGNSAGVFLSQVGRLFGPETVYEVGDRSSGATLADLNRDGYPDLVVSNSNMWSGGSSGANSNSVTELLNLGAQANLTFRTSNTALTASSDSFVQGTSVTFTATVTGNSSGGATPSGSVRFADQTGVQQTVVLVASGTGSATASFMTSGIGLGADRMIAAYLGDSTFAPSFASIPLTVTVVPPGFTLSGTGLNVAPGAATGNTSTITLTPAGGFTGNVTLSAAITASPAGAVHPPTLSFGSTSPVAITGAGSASAVLTVSTTAAQKSAYVAPERNDVRWCGISVGSLAALVLLGTRRRRIRWGAALQIVLLLAVISGLGLGCGGSGGGTGGGGGGGGTGTPGTTAGAYTVTVTGTSGTITATNTMTVTVE